MRRNRRKLKLSSKVSETVGKILHSVIIRRPIYCSVTLVLVLLIGSCWLLGTTGDNVQYFSQIRHYFSSRHLSFPNLSHFIASSFWRFSPTPATRFKQCWKFAASPSISQSRIDIMAYFEIIMAHRATAICAFLLQERIQGKSGQCMHGCPSLSVFDASESHWLSDKQIVTFWLIFSCFVC